MQLVVTGRRARALGMDSQAPVVLSLREREDPAAIVSLATAAVIGQRGDSVPVGPGASAAIGLAKLAELLPALLIADRTQHAGDRGLIEVEAAAIASFRTHLAQSLRIAGSGRVPIGATGVARLVVFRDAIGGSHAALILGEPDYDGAH